MKDYRDISFSFDKLKQASLKIKLLLSLVLGSVIVGIAYYVKLPPINIHSSEFWGFLTFTLIVYLWPFLLKGSHKHEQVVGQFRLHLNFWVIIAIVLPIAISAVGGFFSSTFFNAKKYASVISVEEAVFEDDMQETTDVTNIALMDTNSAVIIGNRALGSLSEVVSQYSLSNNYSQINLHGKPEKVSNLEYNDFFKWLNNRKNGIPGYVCVDPVNNTSEYVKLEAPMHYAESGHFSDNLTRALRFRYPTKIFENVSFEIDENGVPYYVVSCSTAKIGLTGAMDINEVIVFNPNDGTSELYKVGNVPAWIDIVYDGYLACDKYNWQGIYSGGFWNSVIGNKGCKKTTADFGYIVIEDDVWYFTGVTSITSDESNIGFILTNARTGEYKYYPVVGAEEYSAMSAAQGEVQEKGYVASFPSLVNISGNATYIMVLKDSGGLVKLYALVNVEQYSIVATGQTQQEAMVAYKQLLSQNGIVTEPTATEPEKEIKETNIVATDIRLATIDGNTVVYITAEDGSVYKALLSENESLILVRKDDQLLIKYSETEINGIYSIESFEVV